MNKNFKNRVIKERIVDTKNYRYCVIEEGNQLLIKKLPIEYLGTTQAINGWKIVK